MSHHFVNQLIHVIWSTDNCRYIIPDPIQAELNAYVMALIEKRKREDASLFMF